MRTGTVVLEIGCLLLYNTLIHNKPMTNLLQNYTLEDFVKCRNQKEWVCDECRKCGDRDCCSGNHIMFRVPKTDDCLCSICMSNLK